MLSAPKQHCELISVNELVFLFLLLSFYDHGGIAETRVSR